MVSDPLPDLEPGPLSETGHTHSDGSAASKQRPRRKAGERR